jgi:hypothetical protein
VSGVKSMGSTHEVRPKLSGSRAGGEIGMHGVAVKCVDIMWNTGGEGESLERI